MLRNIHFLMYKQAVEQYFEDSAINAAINTHSAKRLWHKLN